MKRNLVAEAKRRLAIVLCLAMGAGTAILSETPARAQNQNSRPLQSSDLAKENLSRVAASAGEIKPLLLKDSGLMVELKRWVAKDATDHGQIITETDLSDDSIFDRLENDVQFRAVATLLLQKYGYLVPQVNPSSALAREQLLLTQERVKWLVQEEAEARSQKHTQVMQKARSCAAGVELDCNQQQLNNAPGQGMEREQQIQEGQPQIPPPTNPGTPANPSMPNDPTYPGQGTNPLERAQLMQTGGDLSDLSQLGSGDSIDSLSTLGSSDDAAISPNLLRQPQGAQTGQSASSSPLGDNADLQSLAISGGSDVPSGTNQNEISPFATNQQQNGSRLSSSPPQWRRSQ